MLKNDDTNKLTLSFSKNIFLVRNLLEKNTELSFQSLRTRLTPAYWLAVLGASLAAWGFEYYYANAQFDTLYFRLAVCVFGIPLFISPFPKSDFLERNQRIYFVAFMFLLFPSLFSWNALANAAFAKNTEALSGAWLTEYALAVFIFLGCFSRPITGLVMSFIALVSTSAIAYFSLSPSSDAFLGVILFMVATIITCFCVILTTHQQLNYVLQHRLETAYSVGSRVAHELRTPLLSIRNFADAANQLSQVGAKNSVDFSEELSGHLGYILREVDFSNRTIDILLVSTSKAPFKFDPKESFLATDVVHTAVSSYPYSNSAERQCVQIRPGAEFEAVGPSDLVIHALYNLIKNALLAANSYSDKEIEAHYFKAGEKGVITITDNGPGIPLRLQHKVFEDFFTTRNPGDGTGLGLAFCKSLMAQIGGKIDYQRIEKLSVFRMTFPLV